MAKQTKTSKASETKIKTSKATVAAETKGRKFDGDFSKLPSSRTLLALVIRSIETGETMRLPTDKDEALAMLGYERSTAPKSAVN